MELALALAGPVLLLVGWLLGKNSQQNKIQAALSEREAEKSRFEQEQRLREDRDQQLQEQRAELQALRNRFEETNRDLSARTTELEGLRTQMEEQEKKQKEADEQMLQRFQNLANRILLDNSSRFKEQNKEQLDGLLKPMQQRIMEFQKKVEESNTQDVARAASLKEQLKQLMDLNQVMTQEAKNLTLALRGDSKTQGNWGEMQLEGILEKAGLQKELHYFKEKNYKTEEGANQRLDYIINLPDGKNLVLDSKVSLSAYSRYFETEDEAARSRYLKEHLNSIYTHIRTLSDKNYQNLHGIGSPDYVMMFIANEPALFLALREDPELYDKAWSRNIVLVGTTTLLATLRTISYIWKQDLRNKNAEEIARQAGALYDKFVGFSEDLIKLGGQLETATKTYKASMNKLTEGTGNLVRRTERLRDLGAQSSKTQNQRLIDRAGSDRALQATGE